MKFSKHLLFLIIALISINVNAQQTVSLTINVETAGTLQELIPSSQKYQITNLTLSGHLNDTDIRYISEMAGKFVDGTSPDGKLSVLDLLEAQIVTNSEGAYSSLNTIGALAFHGCTSLTAITLPNSVTKIGMGAFSGCRGLTSITIPNSVTTIEEAAFSDCSGLTSVTFPNSLTTIGTSAFSGCTGLTSITIPYGITTIGNYAYANCPSLKEFIVSDNNPAFKSIAGVLFNKDETRLIAYPNSKSNTYTIPNSVTIIGNHAFYGCSGLSTVTFPNSITTIEYNAFGNCVGLSSVTFPNSITTIESHAFIKCKGLSSITFPNSVTTIGNTAFSDCTGLTSVTFSNSVTTIGHSAFSGCTGLTSIIIPKSVTTIGDSAFGYCTSLNEYIVSEYNPSYKSIDGVLFSKDGAMLIAYPYSKSDTYTIPNNVTIIGNDAFKYCKGLTTITIPNSVTSIGNFAFSSCTGLTSITIPKSVTKIGSFAFTSCTGLTSITIPNSISTIEELTFASCKGLTSVTIPNSVTSIMGNAFAFCRQIKQIYCEGTKPPIISSNSFTDINNTCELYVPKGTYSAYKSDPEWGKFKNIIELVTTSISDIGASNLKVYTENGSIIVQSGKLGDTVDIYSVSGSLLNKIKITDNIVRISVAPKKIYIIKTGDKSFKIALQ